MILETSAAQAVAGEVRRWLDSAVIGLNLCPFAKAVQVKGQVRYAVSDATDEEGVLQDLETELLLLSQTDPDSVDTTLLILPEALPDFYDFNDFEELSERHAKAHATGGRVAGRHLPSLVSVRRDRSGRY
ncbi:hypothetical protein D554_3750 [Bordetella holmesii 30539]|uniref:PF07209 domain protein n=2 Tax=Bordetella holmesii TaxID=35814 RepID=A0A158M0Y9_9BORD|nr:hypothetical protein D558_3841 [Bordetella holmesii 44057]EWM41270.1 hypothetical protein D555_3915 [Bordetella holmesii 35009]EWM42345.1 hypothetical protein D556_3844 [Bordetella holmesii 41130]EWM45162.1 hypothetical protein D557_3151 [Bordetella holmesii 70147]EXF88473.1 hypothetical protein D554_3750 [Bordetella holmesii 30539]EXX94475.1 hypothetical protein D559_1884 [Bordetella holmesii 1058]KAK66517.1 PF07209 domain protein [Bordetella holmesii H620]KAK82828.1 PF07209 domain prote